MPQIWTESYIWQLHNDADDEICNRLDLIYVRFPLHIIANQAIYTLPDWVRRVDAVYWKGKKVDPISYESMILFQNSTSSTESYYYCLWPTGIKDIRLHPAPNLDILPHPFVVGNLNKWRDSVDVMVTDDLVNPLSGVSYISPLPLNTLDEQLSMM